MTVSFGQFFRDSLHAKERDLAPLKTAAQRTSGLRTPADAYDRRFGGDKESARAALTGYRLLGRVSYRGNVIRASGDSSERTVNVPHPISECPVGNH